MPEEACFVCGTDEGHNEDIIWVQDGDETKSFCPNTLKRIWSEEEAEEMSEEDPGMEKASKERIKLVRPARPAVWKVVVTSEK